MTKFIKSRNRNKNSISFLADSATNTKKVYSPIEKVNSPNILTNYLKSPVMFSAKLYYFTAGLVK